MRIAVTGATGFIGRHLVSALLQREKPEQICCLVRSSEQAARLQALGIRTQLGDLQDAHSLKTLCSGADLIFHLAACVRYGVAVHRTTDFHAINVQGTSNLLQACAPTTQRFIHMSSINAVERRLGDPCRSPLTEESPCHPQTPYGRSKLASEEAACRLAAEKGIPYLILRPPSIVYGRGCSADSGMATLIRMAASGSVIARIPFPGRFSILHVQDLAEGTVNLAFSDQHKNETFFLADEPPRTCAEICSEISAQMKRGPRPLQLPRFLFSAANTFIRWAAPIPGAARVIPFQLLMLSLEIKVALRCLLMNFSKITKLF